MVVVGIVVVDIAFDMGYMGPYFETVVPSETITDMGIEVQPKIGEEPGTEVGPCSIFTCSSTFIKYASIIFSLMS